MSARQEVTYVETPKETERYSKTAAPATAAETSEINEAGATAEAAQTSSPTRLRVLLETGIAIEIP